MAGSLFAGQRRVFLDEHIRGKNEGLGKIAPTGNRTQI